MKKQPEKTAQTKQSMIEAFWQIAKIRGLGNVTISEITKKAGLNRGTYYVYFTDLNDLLYQAEDEIIQDLRTKMHAFAANGQPDIRMLTTQATQTIGQYDEKLFLLLGRNGDPLFLDRLRREFSAVFATVMASQADALHGDYLIAYITSAFTGLLQYWYENGKSISLSELSEIAYGMVLHGVMGRS